MAVAEDPQPDPEEKDFACTGVGAAEVVWSVPTERRAVALTFDDGPHPVLTPMVADVLASRGVRATFFVIGSVAEAHPSLVRRLLDDGHELANHTWSHQPMAHVDGRAARDEVLGGHICRCTGYVNIRAAIDQAWHAISGEGADRE